MFGTMLNFDKSFTRPTIHSQIGERRATRDAGSSDIDWCEQRGQHRVRDVSSTIFSDMRLIAR